MELFDALCGFIGRAASSLGSGALTLLLSPSSDVSLASLLTALVIATLWLMRRRLARNAPVRTRAMLRMLFPRRWLLARSAMLDAKLMVLNTFVFGGLLAGAVLSHQLISRGTKGLLHTSVGTPAPVAIPDLAAAAVLTLALFLAYELAYWVYHYLSHTVPALWELHKVHHSAEVLNPLTNGRVHPIESVLFLNTMALFLGLTDGIVTHLLGRPTQQFTIADANVIVVVFTYLVAHLHHSHIWIPLTGVWGRIFISPAHHQIHHSTNPAHFNKNMGSVLAIWDWLFGTLHIPGRRREQLVFGLGPEDQTEHSVRQELLRPVTAAVDSLRHVGRA